MNKKLVLQIIAVILYGIIPITILTIIYGIEYIIFGILFIAAIYLFLLPMILLDELNEEERKDDEE